MSVVSSSSNEPIAQEHCRSLFVGDLSCFCVEEDIFPLFQKFGEVENIRIMRGKDEKNLGYGFVTFKEVQSAIDALQAEGEMILGRPVR
jgi:RNA recognition motif-containing protein